MVCGEPAQDAFDQDRIGYDPWVSSNADWAYCKKCDVWTEVEVGQ